MKSSINPVLYYKVRIFQGAMAIEIKSFMVLTQISFDTNNKKGKESMI